MKTKYKATRLKNVFQFSCYVCCIRNNSINTNSKQPIQDGKLKKQMQQKVNF